MGARNVVELFLAGARVVGDAVADPAVGAAWDIPSVLEEQTVGSLAGHLARGSVWAIAEYLATGEPDGPVAFDSAGEYFATIVSRATPELHAGVRERGAALAAMGQADLVATLRTRIEELQTLLPSLPVDRLVAVVAGTVMRLSDYLETRIVEQTVHLDDLARSLDREPWSVDPAALALTIDVGVHIGTANQGEWPMVRALYRRGLTDALPVM